MDHGGMDHGDMPMCQMGVWNSAPFQFVPRAPSKLTYIILQMLFTWDTNNLCIIFKWWHIRTTPGLIFSLLAVVALTAFFEAIRSASRRYESWATKRQDEVPSTSSPYPPIHKSKSYPYFCSLYLH